MLHKTVCATGFRYQILNLVEWVVKAKKVVFGSERRDKVRPKLSSMRKALSRCLALFDQYPACVTPRVLMGPEFYDQTAPHIFITSSIPLVLGHLMYVSDVRSPHGICSSRIQLYKPFLRNRSSCLGKNKET